MSWTIHHVDAFTKEPFAGNPAGVCLLPEPRDASWMQSIASEMNLSETAFLERRPEDFSLRWFTPAVEVDLCGHATLASAHVLWETGELSGEAPARFQTRSGLLTAKRLGEWIELDFPAEPAEEAAAPPGMLEALGVTAKFVGRNRMDFLIEVESEATVRALEPDFRRLKSASGAGRGVMVTSRSASQDYDFVSRYFAPAAGIDEDPVTGSTHCCLTPFWAQRLGKSELRAHQASRRGGFLLVRDGGERVYIAGQAVTVMRGDLLTSGGDAIRRQDSSFSPATK